MNKLMKQVAGLAFFLGLAVAVVREIRPDFAIGAFCTGAQVECLPAWLLGDDLVRYVTLALNASAFLLTGLALGRSAPRGSFRVALSLLTLGVIQWGMLLPAEDAPTLSLGLGIGFSGLLQILLAWRLWVMARAEPAHGMGSGGRVWVGFALLLLLVQIVLGQGVEALDAGRACPDFPTCHGRWWPELDYAAALRDLGVLLAGGEMLSLEALRHLGVALHWLHRLGAGVVFAVLAGLSLRLMFSGSSRVQGRAGMWLSFWLLVELSLGLAVLRWPEIPGVGAAHAVGAWMIALVLMRIAVLADVPRIPPQPRPEVPARDREEPAAGKEPGLAVEIPVSAARVPAPTLGERLRLGLSRTRGGFSGLLAHLSGRVGMDAALVEEVETTLLMADVGVETTRILVGRLEEALRAAAQDADAPRRALREEMLNLLKPCQVPLQIAGRARPFVLLVVGVNGVGKTTTIGKLAHRFQSEGLSVMLAAGDTFRAAAVEQLQVWGERNGIPVVAQHTGADSASVIFDAMQSAQARGIDVLIADTAGRLHTKSNLMEELRKIHRILGRLDPSAPHEVLLVLDAGTGQNALSQARQFHETASLTGIALTKLDGTAKGGMIFPLARELGVPIRFIGVGEGIEDLQTFDAERFVDVLLEPDAA